MWKVLKRSKQECRRLRDKVEETAAKQADALSVKNLREELTAEERKHVETCRDCQEAVQEFFAAKELFQPVPSFRQEARPWFAKQVITHERDACLAEGGHLGGRRVPVGSRGRRNVRLRICTPVRGGSQRAGA